MENALELGLIGSAWHGTSLGVLEGIAKTIEMEVASTAQQNSGIRLIDMPGARVWISVTMKLIEPTVVDTPSNTIPSA